MTTHEEYKEKLYELKIKLNEVNTEIKINNDKLNNVQENKSVGIETFTDIDYCTKLYYTCKNLEEELAKLEAKRRVINLEYNRCLNKYFNIGG